jgi:hypothetical protein
MGGELFDELLGSFEGVDVQTPDGLDTIKIMESRIKSGFAVFFFQHPSILGFQRAMKKRQRRNNMETLFKVKEIPCDNEIRSLLDRVEPYSFREVFSKDLVLAAREGVIDQYRVLDGGILLALDGTWYFASQKVHCKHCLHKTKNGETTYYHSALTGAIVRPGSNSVLPVMPELISNEDGCSQANLEKQDCELNAGKRWLANYGKELAWLKPTLLGDDLFSNYPFCTAVLKENMHFIFTCKPASHPWLTETVENSVLEEKIVSKWKIENEHNNVLKNHGYNLEHNFGWEKPCRRGLFHAQLTVLYVLHLAWLTCSRWRV